MRNSINKIKFFALTVVIILSYLAGKYLQIDLKSVETFLKGLPLFYAALIFVLLYCALTFFFWLLKDAFKIIGAFLWED